MLNIICKSANKAEEKKLKDMPQRPMSKNCKNKFNVKREKLAKEFFWKQQFLSTEHANKSK